MPRPRLKICGLRQPEQAAAVARLGVDAIGVIGVAGTPRFLEPAERPALFKAVAAVNPTVLGVLVVADPGADALEELNLNQGHQVVQLHGQESPGFCAALRERLGCSLWKALRVRSKSDLDQALTYVGAVDALVLDAWAPDQLGGTGQAIPLAWLRDFAPPLPWWLAGGVSPERLPGLLRELRPDGFDASSGVERSPGDKDLSRVKLLVSGLRDDGGSGSGEDQPG
ncbi:phosphoribosylanthranilate isomerase [Cyanobium sp. Morenito 9A2]|uniref:phosphoribosylanthranilate isomerase n=1 Tax=Cyanobium sp. Morenito 9A2 TaxID=2823718 RepID=UPI0020CC8E17|nr:phosphoribosylanthranilate isomerase [Cyanobium sp. Morenito 9A2]MCP9849298.1 phosphoribosylanthranilate isomerase [Cyanobium sp. Morenito 9A2]